MIEVALEDIQVQVFKQQPTGIGTLDAEVRSYRKAIAWFFISILDGWNADYI